jgi:cytochrome P450
MTQVDMAVERLGAEYFADPFSVHARLRAQHPVARVIMPGGMPARLITGYAQARAALNDPRLVKVPKRMRTDHDSIFAALHMHMLNVDPPDHDRLRRLVSKAFTARRVEGLRPRITAITADLLDGMSTQREVDLLAAFAFPLPITVICELLGVPVADRDLFRLWSTTIVADNVSPEVFTEHATAMINYFRGLLATRRGEPTDDLVSALIAARDEDDRLSENELLSMMFLLLVGGHETTVNLITSGTLALLLNPGELARLRADPELLGSAVEELLRYVNPVNNATFRLARKSLEIDGVRIDAGEVVLVSLSGANWDESRFAGPDRLDLSRDNTGHLAFGHGIHYCMGAPLARLEGVIAFRGLLDRFPSLTLAVPPDTLRWRPSTLMHGLESLPVRLVPASSST